MDKGCNPKPWHKEVGHRLRPLTWMNPADGIAATEMILLTSRSVGTAHVQVADGSCHWQASGHLACVQQACVAK